jgi:hypothetical protein
MNVQGACIASRLLTAGSAKVGFMYRRDPAFGTDSGWVFITGQETQTELDDPNQFVVCDLATIADIDSDVSPFLDAPAGSAMVRDAHSGRFEPDYLPEDAMHGPELLSAGTRQELDGAISVFESSKTVPPPPALPPAVDVEPDYDFCEKCGAPLEVGEVEFRARTDAGRFVQVPLCATCAEHRDGIGDRMIWPMAALLAIAAVVALISWFLNLTESSDK